MYLGRSVETTLLTPFLAIALKQIPVPTEEPTEHTKNMLDHIPSQEDTVITYPSRSMTLAVHSDAGYKILLKKQKAELVEI